MKQTKFSVLLLLSLIAATVRADHISIFIVTGQSNARLQYAMGIDSGLRASGLWENVKVYNAQISGHWLVNWVIGTEGNYSPGPDYTSVLWADDGSSGLQQMIQQLESEGHTVTVEGFFWFHGEGDTGSATQQVEYAPRLTWMIEDLRNHYGDFNILITEIDWNHDMPDELAAANRTPEDIEAIRSAQRSAAANLGGTTFDSRGRDRIDLWHIGDRDDSRGLYGIATDFGAEQAHAFIDLVHCKADLNGDGSVDFFDAVEFVDEFSAGCP